MCVCRYSCFTKDKVFDPNTGLPPRMRKWASKDESDEDKSYDGVSDDEPSDKGEIPLGCEWVPAPARSRPASASASAMSSHEQQKSSIHQNSLHVHVSQCAS